MVLIFNHYHAPYSFASAYSAFDTKPPSKQGDQSGFMLLIRTAAQAAAVWL
jgi:hypothetical protein